MKIIIFILLLTNNCFSCSDNLEIERKCWQESYKRNEKELKNPLKQLYKNVMFGKDCVKLRKDLIILEDQTLPEKELKYLGIIL